MALSISQQSSRPFAEGDLRQSSQPPGKLAKAAREFESILLQNWLEKMNHSFAGPEENQDAAHDTVTSLGTQAIATALAVRGGIGIARMLLRQLQPKPKPVTDQVRKPNGI